MRMHGRGTIEATHWSPEARGCTLPFDPSNDSSAWSAAESC